MDKISVADARKAEAVGRHVRLQGWVRTRRDSKGGFSFIELNDGSCQGNVQVVAPGELANYEAVVKHLHTGASVSIDGEVKASPAKGQATEVLASNVELVGDADSETYQLQKKGHSFEFLRGIAHLRPRTNTFGAIARLRHQVSMSIHQFFHEHGFYYIHTPVITASDCEGAGAMFRVSTIDPGDAPKVDGKVDYTKDFFGKPAYLTVSGQLQGEAFACALGKIYTFGPTFRAENSNTPRHLAEFWMIEPEMAFYELTDNMDLAEAFLKRIISDALKFCMEDLKFFAEKLENNKELFAKLENVLNNPFKRVSYTEGVDILLKSGKKWEYPVAWGNDLQSEHERYLAEQHFKCPVILYDYPRTLKPFYMKVNDDQKTVRAMDVLVPGVGEIIGGSQREEKLDVLESRMREQGLEPEGYGWYLDLRRYGTVPHSGFGLGLERTILFLSGMANIRDVIPFPRTPGNAEY
ncbi:asparaginyl-trna synthetase : Asparagine--tRNA ligase OS=Pirellula staleyi (strain ATCC 27377 / DSM 6068 / ICPB 4128) GN=asnS PE=3 SV=1: tRNA_anti-codon: tRNA-synt_2 [Gemmata massiliana]|uniref:Asparagine--tRNA ligase n=1 Tax=Gemmata massiliana TaxID=1210884 RepID=A0A6P2D4I9_9BACT|nr:asparagine--tRNA ligase [Gemmata massiliana]VTR95355.1 asparaginyl-trna synthetase : Asparagine--tRNA ligase OS=Pirellula staleyi (strain ATCC 27377 / DSM 6068 / ICPB 4128) GN=asnS PE=3 SV=1: tRNA_anti-codon: tRNA-synt_2 [Gemmata massiliana]